MSSGSGALTLFATVSRLHIVTIGCLGTLTFGWLLSGRYLLVCAAFSALDWFLVNLLNRVVDIPEDEANRIAGTDFVRRNARTMKWGGLALLAASIAATPLVAGALVPWRLAFHALGLAYNWPLLPGGRRIKQLYFWKNTASAVGFLLTLFAYPLAIMGGRVPLAPGVTSTSVVLLATFFFLFELSYEVLYDLRDAAGDLASGIRTYPVVHGEAVALRIVYALAGAAAAALVLGYATGALPWRAVVMIAAPALQIAYTRRVERARRVTTGDCVTLTWIGASLLACYHLWILAKLPGV